VAQGKATHKVLMCQPYDIYCLRRRGGENVLFRVDVYYGQPDGGVNVPQQGNKWQS